MSRLISSPTRVSSYIVRAQARGPRSCLRACSVPQHIHTLDSHFDIDTSPFLNLSFTTSSSGPLGFDERFLAGLLEQGTGQRSVEWEPHLELLLVDLVVVRGILEAFASAGSILQLRSRLGLGRR
jgi:hypothetical protein